MVISQLQHKVGADVSVLLMLTNTLTSAPVECVDLHRKEVESGMGKKDMVSVNFTYCGIEAPLLA